MAAPDPEATLEQQLQGLETRIRRVAPASLRLLEANARYMPATEYRRLVDNLRADGCLTSLPLVAAAGDAPLCDGADPADLEVLSGNHRTMAAAEAGLAEIEVLEIVTPLSAERKVAIQLAHNRIVGLDDPGVLLKLYERLDLDLKAYSGLCDDDFKVEELDISALAIGAPQYEELLLTFLPEDRKAFQECVERIAKSTRTRGHLLAAYGDFCRFFDAVVRVKEATDIHNVSIAVRRLAELACERLDQLEAEAEPPTDGSPEEGQSGTRGEVHRGAD